MPSLSFFLFTLAATCAIVPFSGVSALSLDKLSSRAVSGINCDGSSECRDHRGALSTIKDVVNRIPVGIKYYRGEQIACTGYNTKQDEYGASYSTGGDGICASVGENTESYTVGESTNGQENNAADIIEDLLYHGCTACGTAPTNRGGNKLSDGSISVNYVQHVCLNINDKPCGL